MTIEEAQIIFKDWQYFAEINDKLSKVFFDIPESFLPYPIDMLEEALNMVAKQYFESGDKKTSEALQTSIATLLFYKDDVVALDSIINSEMLKNQKLKDAFLKNLENSRDSWLEFKKENLFKG